MTSQPPESGLGRRGLLGAGAASAALPLLANPPAAAQPAPNERQDMTLTLRINGQEHPLTLDPRITLLDALREHLGLTGTKKGCDHGQCGACTVLSTAARVLSCLTLAATARGPGGHHHRGSGRPRRRAASDAAGLHRPRRLPVRLLHARADHVGRRLRRAKATPAATPRSANT